MSQSNSSMNQNGFNNTKANKRTKGTNRTTRSIRKLGRFAVRTKQLRQSAHRPESDTGAQGQGDRFVLQSSQDILQSSGERKANTESSRTEVSFSSFFPYLDKPKCENCGSIQIKHYDNRYICYTCGMEDYYDE